MKAGLGFAAKLIQDGKRGLHGKGRRWRVPDFARGVTIRAHILSISSLITMLPTSELKTRFGFAQ
jgi:hypothetical protein